MGKLEPINADTPFDFARSTNAHDTNLREIDTVQMVLRHKFTIALALAVGMGLGVMAYLKMGPMYMATARILVSKKADNPIKGAEATTYGERAEHVALIMSPMIVGEAIKLHKLDQLPSLAKSDAPVEDILDELRVKRSAGQDKSFINVLDITYNNRRPSDARAVVTAIIDAYSKYLAKTHKDYSAQVVSLMTNADQELKKELEQKEAEYLAFRESAPLHWRNAPGAAGTSSDITNIHQDHLLAIDAERRRNILTKAEIKSKLTALQEAIDNGETRESLELLVRQFLSTTGESFLAGPPGTDAMEQQLVPLLLEEKTLLRDFGNNYPDVIAVRKKIETIRKYYLQRGVTLPDVDAELKLRRTPDGQEVPENVDLVTIYMHSLRQKLMELEHRDAKLAQLSEEEGRLAKEYARYAAKDKSMSDELMRVKGLWEAVVKRRSEHQMAQSQVGYTLEQLAPVEDELVIKRPIKFVGAGGVFVVALALGMIYLREMRDNVIRSIADVQRSVQLPVLGSIPEFERDDLADSATVQATGLGAALCYYHRPGSAAAEAYRSTRTALFVGAGAQGAKVIQVTSPEPGDGKSTLVANLAIAIAQAGKKVLQIDADLRCPTAHLLFGCHMELGLSELLTGDITMESAIRETSIANHSLMTAGILPHQPAELLSSPRFAEIVKLARQQFDYVLVDTPPLLVVSDPCIVAPQADGLLLVLKMAKNNNTAARRAKELLATHGADVIGVVANGLEPEDGDDGGYYESYSYYQRTDERSPAYAFTTNSHGPEHVRV